MKVHHKRETCRKSLFFGVDNQCLLIKQKDTDLRPYICPKSGTDVKKEKSIRLCILNRFVTNTDNAMDVSWVFSSLVVIQLMP